MREIGRFRIIRGRVVAIYVEDRYVDPAGPFIKADDLHAIGRMNGLGAYVKTRGSFFQVPRLMEELEHSLERCVALRIVLGDREAHSDQELDRLL